MDRTPPITRSNIPAGWSQVDSFICQLSAIDYADTQLDTPVGVDATFYTTDGTEPTRSSSRGPNKPNDVTEFTISGQGLFTIKYFSVDNNDNQEITKIEYLRLDNQEPVTTCSASSPPVVNGWYQSSPTITLSSFDAISGVYQIYYRWNSNPFQVYTGGFLIPTQGIHTLQFYAIDVAGNTESVKTTFFKLDNESPLTMDDAPSGTQRDPVTVNFLTSDNVAGVANTYYTTDGSTPTTSSTTGSSVTFSETGVYILKYFSVDFAGNAEIPKQSSVDVFIDTEAPHTYISESFPINGTQGWYRTSPLISLIAVDESGIKETKYKLSPVGLTTTALYHGTVDLTATIDLTSNYLVRIEVDRNNNPLEVDIRGVIPFQTTISEIISKINAAFVVTIASETGPGGVLGNGYITIASPTAGTGSALSEVKFLQPLSNDATNRVFGLDESTYPHIFTETVVFLTYTDPVSIPYDEHWQIEFYSVDNKNNAGEHSTKQYKLDSHVPVTTPVISFPPDGDNNWYHTSPDITFDSIDNLSGVFRTLFQWDNNGQIFEYLPGVTTQIPSEGVHVLKYYSIDNAGNIESTKTQDFKLDATPPVTTDDTLYYQGIIFTTKGSGYQQLENENSTILTSNQIKTNNPHVVSVVSIYDVTKTQEYYATSIAGPDLDQIVVKPYVKNENSTRLGNYEIQLVRVPSSGIMSGVEDILRVYNFSKAISYSVDTTSDFANGHLILTGEYPISLGDELQVDYTFEGIPLSSTDTLQVAYYFDVSHEPQVLNTREHTFVVPEIPDYFLDHDVEINLFPTDSYSSISKTYYTTDGSIPTQSSSEGTVIHLTENGIYNIKYFSIDEAGNIEPVKDASYSIRIDKNIPTLSLAIIPDTLEDGENGWFKKNFKIHAEISSDDKLNRFNEDIHESTQHLIETGVNDTIDFEETIGVQLTCTLSPGIYTSQNLATEIQTKLNAIGNSNYSVTVDNELYTQGQLFVLNSDLSGGVFNLKWLSGTNSSKSVAKTIGFNLLDLSGDSTYTSQCYKLKLNDFFVKSVESIQTTISHQEIQLVEILRGVSTFYDEILVTGTRPAPIDINEVLIAPVNLKITSISNIPIVGNLILKKDSVVIPTTEYSFDNSTGKIELYFLTFQLGSTYTAEYSLEDRIVADYTHYVGIEKVDFGLDTINFTTTVQIYNVPERFIGFAGDKVNFEILFPSTSGQFFLQEGQHVVFGRAFDHNSIPETGVPVKGSLIEDISFKLDRIVPVTTDDVLNVGWQQAPITITLTPVDDPSGSGIATTHFTVDGSTPSRLSPSSTVITLTTSGTYILKYFSVDFAGNVEPVKTAAYTIQVDGTAPVTTIFTSPPAPDGNNWWFRVSPTIGFQVVDYNSGVSKTFYKINAETAFTEYLGPFLLSIQGQNTIYFYSEDNVGNVETVKTATVKVDETIPVTTTNVPLGYTSDPVVRFIITDLESGGDTTYFTIDGTDPTLLSPHGDHIDFSSSVTLLLKFFSLDKAGNQESIKTQTVSLDLEPPVIFDFLPVDCIVDETTTQISFKVKDNLSGVNIDSLLVDVDGVEYSTQKNSDYFSYTGTPLEYQIIIYPIQDVLSFQDIELLRVRNVKDIAGNTAPVLEFNFTTQDVSGPWLREVYPAPNAQDVSTNSNVIAYLEDNNVGVDIRTVEIGINKIPFRINSRQVLSFQYLGVVDSAKITIYNKTLTTFINGQRDIYCSLLDSNFDTIKKLELYFNGLPNYQVSILDTRFEQKPSSLLLSVPSRDILQQQILDLFIPEENLNFSFIERGNGYVVFANPNFSLEHRIPVTVDISAADNNGNLMEPFSYIFIPHVYATPSIKKRNYLNKLALEYIEDVHENNLASNYSRSKSTTFYGHHKSIGLEIARHQEEIDHLNEDRDYNTLRPINLYDKLGYLLYTEPSLGLSHDDYRRMLQSLIQIFFKGSLKSSLEEGVSLFTGTDINITEIVFSEGADISQQFMFTVDVILGEGRLLGLDLITISENLSHIFALVKPAHVFIIQRFIWSEQFNFQAGCELQWQKDQYGNFVIDQFGNKIPIYASDDFQAAITQSSTAICDRVKYNTSTLQTEDVREDCKAQKEQIETIIEDVSLQFSGVEDSFHTYYSPLLHDAEEIASISDISVTVNNAQVSIVEFDPITGYIKINLVPAYDDVVVVTYKYNQYFVYRVITFYLNTYSISGNDFVPTAGSIFNHENTYHVYGGLDIQDDRLHAHVCETKVVLQVENLETDLYEVPDCNNKHFFYLNDYTTILDGINWTFDPKFGSYLNDYYSVNRSTTCPLLYWELNDKQQELIELPEERAQYIIDGRNHGLTYDETNPYTDDFPAMEIDYKEDATPSITEDFDLTIGTYTEQIDDATETVSLAIDGRDHGLTYDQTNTYYDDFPAMQIVNPTETGINVSDSSSSVLDQVADEQIETPEEKLLSLTIDGRESFVGTKIYSFTVAETLFDEDEFDDFNFSNQWTIGQYVQGSKSKAIGRIEDVVGNVVWVSRLYDHYGIILDNEEINSYLTEECSGVPTATGFALSVTIYRNSLYTLDGTDDWQVGKYVKGSLSHAIGIVVSFDSIIKQLEITYPIRLYDHYGVLIKDDVLTQYDDETCTIPSVPSVPNRIKFGNEIFNQFEFNNLGMIVSVDIQGTRYSGLTADTFLFDKKGLFFLWGGDTYGILNDPFYHLVDSLYGDDLIQETLVEFEVQFRETVQRIDDTSISIEETKSYADGQFDKIKEAKVAFGMQFHDGKNKFNQFKFNSDVSSRNKKMFSSRHVTDIYSMTLGLEEDIKSQVTIGEYCHLILIDTSSIYGPNLFNNSHPMPKFKGGSPILLDIDL